MTKPALAAPPATFRDIFAVGEFRVLFISFALFLFGETGKTLALAVLLYARTGSELLAALGYAANLLPYALGGLLLLSLADRVPPRALMIGYDLLRLAVVILLASGALPPLAMLGVVTVVGLLAPASGAARTALLPELLPGDAYVLGRSTFTIVAAGSQIVGFGAGAVLLGLVGPYGLLWFTAMTCAASPLLLRFGLAYRPARGRVDGGNPTDDAASVGAVRQTWRTNRSLMADSTVRRLLFAQWLPGSLMVGAEGVVVPYATELGVRQGTGVLLMATAVGMLAGDLAVGRLLAPTRRERLTPGLAVLVGVPLLGFWARPGLPVAVALLAVSAFGLAYHLGFARRFLDAVPPAQRGQAFGLLSTGLMTFQGLAMAVAGGLAELIRPDAVIALAGVSSLAAALACWRTLRPTERVKPATRRSG